MGIFADPGTIQAQMAAAADRKRQRQQQQPGGSNEAAAAYGSSRGLEGSDWKALNKERKERKRRAAVRAMLDEPDE